MENASTRIFDAHQYWENRYALGGDSGAGSKGEKYAFKRDFINHIVQQYSIKTIVDFGCGDGSQIAEITVNSYYGLDISPSAVARCRERYADRPEFQFDLITQTTLTRYDLAISLDVLYHIIDPSLYAAYLHRFFSHSQYSLLYANFSEKESSEPHILHRNHFQEIERLHIPTRLIEQCPNPTKPSVGFSLFKNG